MEARDPLSAVGRIQVFLICPSNDISLLGERRWCHSCVAAGSARSRAGATTQGKGCGKGPQLDLLVKMTANNISG